MITFFTTLAIIVFFGGAYFMGNSVLNTFDEDWIEQLMSSLYGIICWLAIACLIFLCCLMFLGVNALFS